MQDNIVLETLKGKQKEYGSYRMNMLLAYLYKELYGNFFISYTRSKVLIELQAQSAFMMGLKSARLFNITHNKGETSLTLLEALKEDSFIDLIGYYKLAFECMFDFNITRFIEFFEDIEHTDLKEPTNQVRQIIKDIGIFSGEEVEKDVEIFVFTLVERYNNFYGLFHSVPRLLSLYLEKESKVSIKDYLLS